MTLLDSLIDHLAAGGNTALYFPELDGLLDDGIYPDQADRCKPHGLRRVVCPPDDAVTDAQAALAAAVEHARIDVGLEVTA